MKVRAEECGRSMETGVTDGGEAQCRYWELNPGCLQGEQELLNAELSLVPVYSSSWGRCHRNVKVLTILKK